MSKHEIFTVLMTLINLVWRLAFVYIWTKFRLINRVATVYLLQCKTNFFIHLCFYGKNLRQIKEDLSWNIQINIQKDFFWFIYTRRRPSASVSRDFLISNLGSFRVICLISINFFRVMILFFRVTFTIFIIGNIDLNALILHREFRFSIEKSFHFQSEWKTKKHNSFTKKHNSHCRLDLPCMKNKIWYSYAHCSLANAETNLK